MEDEFHKGCTKKKSYPLNVKQFVLLVGINPFLLNGFPALEFPLVPTGSVCSSVCSYMKIRCKRTLECLVTHKHNKLFRFTK